MATILVKINCIVIWGWSDEKMAVIKPFFFKLLNKIYYLCIIIMCQTTVRIACFPGLKSEKSLYNMYQSYGIHSRPLCQSTQTKINLEKFVSQTYPTCKRTLVTRFARVVNLLRHAGYIIMFSFTVTFTNVLYLDSHTYMRSQNYCHY